MAPVLMLVLGAALLTAGAEAFAEHVAPAARALGVSVLALGLLLVGAEPEEAVTAALASGQGHPGLAVGDAIGANLVILTLTLGLAASLSRLPVSRRVVQYAVAAAVAGALSVLFLADGVVSRLEGTVLVLCYAAGVGWVWRRERRPPAIGELAELSAGGTSGSTDGEEEGPRAVLLVGLGLLGMVAGGFLALRGAQGLVQLLSVSESVVGLTVLALATSAEMLALVWAASRKGVGEVALAGAVGSVAYNATISLGAAALVRPLRLGPASPALGVGVLTAVLPLLLVAGRRTGSLPRPVGALLLVGYLAVTGWLFRR